MSNIKDPIDRKLATDRQKAAQAIEEAGRFGYRSGSHHRRGQRLASTER